MAAEVTRVFVGTAPDGADAESCAVLEYTIRKHTTGPVKITWMAMSRDPRSPWHGWRTRDWITPFSGFRTGVAEVCGFRGRAIYMDSDMIVRADLRELAGQKIRKGAFALARRDGRKLRTCVMLIDCKRARGVLPRLATLRKMKNPVRAIDPEFIAPLDWSWNCVDLRGARGIDDPRIRILHYSSMESQPHLEMARERLAKKGRTHWYDGPKAPHPRPEIPAEFARLLKEAEAAGFRVSNYEPAQSFGEYAKRSLSKKPLKGHR